jgi:hypothetical protein
VVGLRLWWFGDSGPGSDAGIEGFEGMVEFAKKTGGGPLQIDDHLETKPINIVGMPTEALSLYSPLAEQAPCDHQ